MRKKEPQGATPKEVSGGLTSQQAADLMGRMVEDGAKFDDSLDMDEQAQGLAHAPEGELSAEQVMQAMLRMARRIQGPVEVGIWQGRVHSAVDGRELPGPHVAAFRNGSLVAQFGQVGEWESHACAAVFSLAANHAELLAKALGVQAADDQG